MTTSNDGEGLRRVTGWRLVIGAVTFAVAATVLSTTFSWPDILREPPDVVLSAFAAGGTSLVWTWFAVGLPRWPSKAVQDVRAAPGGDVARTR